MRTFILLALAGLGAQLVDGSLGMAYGVSSTTLLLFVGVAPALASAAVHIAEVGTTAVSGISHASFGNVDWSKIVWMAVPGGIGAFAGAYLLVYASTAEATAGLVEPVVAIILFSLGVYVLSRFAFRRNERPVHVRPVSRKFLSPLGLVAGFLDAFGGGGWGPISTPTLLSSGRMEPRKVIGTVDTSEFVVALCASIGFLLSLSFAQIPWQVVGALFAGGVIAAPIAAWIVKKLPTRILGTAVGGVILIVNMKTFFEAIGVTGVPATIGYFLIIGIWAAAIASAIAGIRRDRAVGAETQPA
ncbi:MAG TPA: sulfite exporter TauE/SafE family protein [Rubrobacter sp.]|nr:sulfite exporter TauE/SafE family protein [Rubrobacter sp.]